MKFCPKCQTKYDEEVIKFCTKDGMPLAEDNPVFTAMPSQSSIDDIGEETLITRNRPRVPPPAPVIGEPLEPSARVVIPIGEDRKQAVRPLEKPGSQAAPPRKSNTGLIVFLTIFGTVMVLAVAVGGWWFLSGNGTSSNTNSKGNSNLAANSSNSGINYNSNLSDFNIGNSNINANTNINANANANLKPTPTKTPTPKPANSNTNSNANVSVNLNSNTIINISPANVSPANSSTATPTPPGTPKPSPTPSKSPANSQPSNVNLGVMNSRASSLAKPSYPPVAKQMGASGQVVVQILVDESGKVVSAKAVSGHNLLRSSAENAARQSRFNPVKIDDKPVRANGTVVYNFID